MLYLSIRVQEELVLQARPFPFHSTDHFQYQHVVVDTDHLQNQHVVVDTESDRHFGTERIWLVRLGEKEGGTRQHESECLVPCPLFPGSLSYLGKSYKMREGIFSN